MLSKKKLSFKKNAKQHIQAQDFKKKLNLEVNELIKLGKHSTASDQENLTDKQKIWREELLKEISQQEESGSVTKLTQTPEIKSTGANPDLVARWRQRQRRKKRWLLAPVLIILILAVYNLFRLDKHWPQVADYLPWPAVIINNQIVWASELKKETNFVKKFYNVPEAESIAFNHLLEERLISLNLNNLNLHLTDVTLKQEMARLAKDFGSEQAFYDYLQQAFNIKPEELTNRVLKPYLKKRLLYNYLVQDPKLTTQTQNMAANIRQQILSNKITFEQAAQKYSQDTTTAAEGGKIGWLSFDTMLPEFALALRNLQPGEISQPIQTILGYHLIRLNNWENQDLLEQDNLDKFSDKTTVHVSHILIKTLDFNTWLEEQKKQARTIKLIPIKI